MCFGRWEITCLFILSFSQCYPSRVLRWGEGWEGAKLSLLHVSGRTRENSFRALRNFMPFLSFLLVIIFFKRPEVSAGMGRSKIKLVWWRTLENVFWAIRNFMFFFHPFLLALLFLKLPEVRRGMWRSGMNVVAWTNSWECVLGVNKMTCLFAPPVVFFFKRPEVRDEMGRREIKLVSKWGCLLMASFVWADFFYRYFFYPWAASFYCRK